jgi:hypothetical protein
LKVQHKQIRPGDQNFDREHGGSGYDDGIGGHYVNPHAGGAYGRGGGMNLPPSGPMAASVGWYSRHGPPPPGGPMPQDAAAAAGMVDAGMNPAHYEDPAVGVPPGEAPPSGHGQEEASAVTGADPLSNMDPIRQSLPDVGTGVATSAAEGEI